LSWGKWRQVGDRAAGCSSQRGCVQSYAQGRHVW
jgi:hypothetical protein